LPEGMVGMKFFQGGLTKQGKWAKKCCTKAEFRSFTQHERTNRGGGNIGRGYKVKGKNNAITVEKRGDTRTLDATSKTCKDRLGRRKRFAKRFHPG